MKYRLPILLVIFGLLAMIGYFFSGKPDSRKLPPLVTQIEAGTTASETPQKEEKRSAPRAVGDVSKQDDLAGEKADEASDGSGKKDTFVKKVLTEKWIGAEGKAGRRRVRIVEANFKYPHIRLEEEVWTDPQTGKKTVNRLLASVADHVMVGLKLGADQKAAVTLLEQNGYRIRAVESGSYILAVLPDFASADAQSKSIAEIEEFHGLIDYAEPDYLVYPCVMPNDPDFGSRKLWGLDNPGVLPQTQEDSDIDAPEAWDVRTSAAGIIVAVTDTGIRYTHEDLALNMWSRAITGEHGMDAYDNDDDPMDTDGHGTHVAGTIGAKGNNGKGISGVAWDVQLMALRFLSGAGGTTSDAVRVIDYARANGAQIINASWGGRGRSESLLRAAQRCYEDGILIVAAAGNNHSNNDEVPHYPASFELPNIISVAATDGMDNLTPFSNFGKNSVDLTAPGADIWSCGAHSDADYQYLSGTSMAAPHVTGALALAKAQFPGDTPDQLSRRLRASVDPFAHLIGKVASRGRLNLEKLLTSTSGALFQDDFENPLVFDGFAASWQGWNEGATREADEDTYSPGSGT